MLGSSRIYTWADVEAVLRAQLENNSWPPDLLSTSCYWDELRCGVRPGFDRDSVTKWIGSLVGPRLETVNGELNILLESLPDTPRKLPIVFEEVEAVDSQPLRLSFETPTKLVAQSQSPSSSDSVTVHRQDDIPIIAFHSFKGGVGRTTLALSLAAELTTDGRMRVLLVDADMEAPGITFMLDERLPDPPISYADVLALAHGDESPGYEKSVTLCASRLRDSQIDGIVVLPAFRSMQAYESMAVRPEHLVRAAENPLVLSDILRRLAGAVGAGLVIVDLRAGVSEVSAGLLLDPSIRRVFVTSLGGQSIRGTTSLLAKIARSDKTVLRGIGEQSATTSDEIHIVFSQVREDQDIRLLEEAQRAAIDAAIGADGLGEPPNTLVVPFDTNLVALSRSWQEALSKIRRSGVGETIVRVADYLAFAEIEKFVPQNQLQSGRSRVANLAERLEFAESGAGDSFLATGAIRNIASDNRSSVPVVAVVGQKGAGKSYMFLQLIKRQQWGKFASDAGVAGLAFESTVYPLVQPFNLKPAAEQITQSARQASGTQLEFIPRPAASVVDKIRAGFALCTHEGEWREYWLNILGYAAGFEFDTAFSQLTAMLKAKNKYLVFALDGLEDLLQSIWDDSTQQMALRALLQDTLAWLGQIPDRRIGAVVFVRRDMVVASVKQNYAQFLHRFGPYELRWSPDEALRLFHWVALRAQVVDEVPAQEVDSWAEEQIVQALIPLWGLKLGTPKSREAHTSEWVLSVLSDFRGQVQARDVIRLLRVASKLSTPDEHWADRILTPNALRKAPRICGKEKVEEIGQESPTLRAIFDRLQKLPEHMRVVPFLPEETQLTADEVALLDRSGVVLREEDGYYMPEMFRHGLGFSVPGGARPKVLALSRRARLGL